jgi:polar amino acid transport system substrate-binding protein
MAFQGRQQKMQRNIKRLSITAAALLAVLVAGQSHAADKGPALYTAAQAQTGATVYQQACAGCHGATLDGGGGPALHGKDFMTLAKSQDMTAASLLDVVAATMPQSDPGSLKADEYEAVVAYLLQQNGFPAGQAALATGAAPLKAAKITP